MLSTYFGTLRERAERSSTILLALAFALSGMMPILLTAQAGAAQLTSRTVTASSSQADATGVSYSFAFTTVAAATPIQSMTFQFCDTPLGTCVLPGTDGSPTATETMDVSHVTAAAGAWSGTVATAFAEYTGVDAGGCSQADGGSGVATQFCVTRTAASNETAGAKTFVISGITNPIIPSSNNEEIYIRIVTYSDTAFATSVDSGTVAASIVNQLTVTGRVQERLVFCVFALEDADTLPADCADPVANESTNVDIGVIDNLDVVKSPVNDAAPTSLGNDRFGAAMINTNASLGVAMTYYASTATSGTTELQAFRVPNSTCTSASSVVDTCFVSADETTGETFVNGTERFGVQVACVNYTAGTTSNLGENSSGVPTSGSGTGGSYNTVYSNTDDSIVDGGDCENTDAGEKFAWNDTATAAPLISSTTVVDDEIVKLRFGATASATTPTGTYSVASTYIATATF